MWRYLIPQTRRFIHGSTHTGTRIHGGTIIGIVIVVLGGFLAFAHAQDPGSSTPEPVVVPSAVAILPLQPGAPTPDENDKIQFYATWLAAQGTGTATYETTTIPAVTVPVTLSPNGHAGTDPEWVSEALHYNRNLDRAKLEVNVRAAYRITCGIIVNGVRFKPVTWHDNKCMVGLLPPTSR
jgi:hypothetical protein